MKLENVLIVLAVIVHTLLILPLVFAVIIFSSIISSISSGDSIFDSLSSTYEHFSNSSIETIYVKDKLLLEIDIKNLSINFESEDYDEDIVMLHLFTNNYKVKDILNLSNDGKKATINNGWYESSNSPENKKREMKIILPRYFKNYVDIKIKSENGDIVFNNLVNFNSIDCSVKEGNIYGIKPKCWGEEKMEIDNDHNINLTTPEKEYKIFKSFNHKEEEKEVNIEHI